MDLNNEYIKLKRSFLEKEFGDMNDFQKKAIFKTNGQLSVFAGAGSGKTTVIINKIAYMVTYGNLYEDTFIPEKLDLKLIERMKECFNENKKISCFSDVINFKKIDPQNILAITFTNKAARELKNRLSSKLDKISEMVLASTFHSFCVRILREHADKFELPKSFTIYDMEDSKKMIKDCQKNLEIDEKTFPVKITFTTISRAKDNLLDFNEFKEKNQNDYRLSTISDVYRMYQNNLKKASAMDFEDLIFNTIILFEKHPEILEEYKDRFKYIMVDEYQDTNYAQHVLINKLVGKNGNVCVVGDDDQSIYKFRGANIENILNFEKQFKDSKIISLEENYRSTKNILNAANSVIENNQNRKGKTLWTQNPIGSKIRVHTAYSEYNEAETILNDIKEKIKDNNLSYNDFAVLYRMSSQSNVIERVFAKNGIPYRIVGGVKFFERREIKDLISYLCVINNVYDEVRLRRIINQPKRAIGERTILLINTVAFKEKKSFFDIMKNVSKYETVSKCAVKINDFVNIMESLIESYKKNKSIIGIYNEVLEKIKYIDYLKNENDDSDARIANVKELASAIVRYEEEKEEPTLSGFLEEVLLAPDNGDDSILANGEITLMTVHASKGLEFENIYLPGFEEGIFPGMQCMFKSEDLEEERRLAYVAITRAKKELCILHSTSRMIFGSTSYNKPSRFLGEIPEEIITKIKSKGWGKPKNGEEKLASAYEVRVKSVISARNFAQFPLSEGFEMELVEHKYIPGENIEHHVFGKGKIMSVIPRVNEKDSLLEINFEKFGLKKFMSKSVKLQKEVIQ